MSAIILDTLDYANKLKAGGFTEQQAETQARALAEVVEKQLATKQDMDNHEANLRRDIEVLRADLKKDAAETKAELIRWVVGVGVLQTTLIVGVLARLAKVI